MTHGHGIWFWLVGAVVLWYSTITVYVSVKGALDIRHMLANLKKNHDAACAEKEVELAEEPSPAKSPPQSRAD
jgi:hypothetical protein